MPMPTRVRDRLALDLCGRCGKRPHVQHKTKCEECLVAISIANIVRDTKQRREAFQKLGGCCRSCKESDEDCLTIDHINDDGKQHRTEFGNSGGHGIYRAIAKNKVDLTTVQLLCANCHQKETKRRARALSKAVLHGHVVANFDSDHTQQRSSIPPPLPQVVGPESLYDNRWSDSAPACHGPVGLS